jgi:hypothetical protein
MNVFEEPDEHTERKESCEDYAHDPYVRAECDEGRCKCLQKNGPERQA